MKDLLRKETSLSSELEEMLNKQSKMEATASNKYLAMASWLEVNGFLHAAEYLYKQAEEEREHFLKLFKYINEVGGVALTPSIDQVKVDYSSIREVFDTALESEITVTKSINKIVAKCRELNDFATEEFMMWYVNEQREEEANARRALELFDLIDVDGESGKFLLDKEIGHIGA
ncbi:ferritin [Marinilongibacter aquaticus]|nr:ferritin [Marinilongibacter aquaticus]UBM60999.1 ferritin [Marinilongibacter aquaticus]